VIELLVLAPLAAFLATLPLAPEAHQLVLSSALGVEGARSPAVSLGRVLAAITMFVAARGSWARSLGRARRKQSIGLGLGLAGGLLGAEIVRRMTWDVRPSPIAVGAGLVLTAVTFATVRVAPRTADGAGTLRVALVVACALALSGLPGGSSVVGAAVGLAWSGKRVRADTILALAAPVELVAALGSVTATGAARLEEALPIAVLGGLLAVSAAVLGVGCLRREPDAVSRLAPRYLALLGVAELAFAWALHGR
jgi:hypothetical protein